MPRSLQHIQDELLVIRCQDGEPPAVEELIARWGGRLRAHAWSLTGDASAAADVSQEAWIAITRGLRRLSDPASFGPWAYRIVTHKCADWTRSQQRKRVLVERVAEQDRAAARVDTPRDDAGLSLQEALAGLRPEARAILSMHYLAEMNVNQIAMAFDIPVGTVKSRLYHAREHLRIALERNDQ